MENSLAYTLSHAPLSVSFEVFPPKGDLALEAACSLMEELTPLSPTFVSVTCSAGGGGNAANTPKIAAMVEERFNTPSVAHMTCMNATSDESLASDLGYLRACGVQNVLALRGDIPKGAALPKRHFAKDLIPILKEQGFCVGAAAYPEGHIECDDDRANLNHLKQKQDAGADFFVTQLVFDNAHIYRFREDAQRAGITAPITYGIMPFMSKSQIQRMVFMCGVSLPSPIIKLLAKYEDDEVSLRKAGIEYACEQFVDLAQHGVTALHVYCMNRVDVAQSAIEALTASGFLSTLG